MGSSISSRNKKDSRRGRRKFQRLILESLLAARKRKRANASSSPQWRESIGKKASPPISTCEKEKKSPFTLFREGW